MVILREYMTSCRKIIFKSPAILTNYGQVLDKNRHVKHTCTAVKITAADRVKLHELIKTFVQGFANTRCWMNSIQRQSIFKFITDRSKIIILMAQ